MKPRTFMAYEQDWGVNHPQDSVPRFCARLGIEVLEARPVAIAGGWFYCLRGRPVRIEKLVALTSNLLVETGKG